MLCLCGLLVAGRLTLELFEQFGEVATRERPLEGSSESFVVPLKPQQPILDSGQRSEVVRGDHLALDDGEVELDLIEPARVHRTMDQDEIGVTALQAFDRARAAV